MRARRFELRLLGVALVGAWGLAAILVLLAYRPGGPLDVVVGITMLVPLAIAIAASCGRRWPAVATRIRWSWRSGSVRCCSSCRRSAACSTSSRRSVRRP